MGRGGWPAASAGGRPEEAVGYSSAYGGGLSERGGEGPGAGSNPYERDANNFRQHHQQQGGVQHGPGSQWYGGEERRAEVPARGYSSAIGSAPEMPVRNPYAAYLPTSQSTTSPESSVGSSGSGASASMGGIRFDTSAIGELPDSSTLRSILSARYSRPPVHPEQPQRAETNMGYGGEEGEGYAGGGADVYGRPGRDKYEYRMGNGGAGLGEGRGEPAPQRGYEEQRYGGQAGYGGEGGRGGPSDYPHHRQAQYYADPNQQQSRFHATDQDSHSRTHYSDYSRGGMGRGRGGRFGGAASKEGRYPTANLPPSRTLYVTGFGDRTEADIRKLFET